VSVRLKNSTECGTSVNMSDDQEWKEDSGGGERKPGVVQRGIQVFARVGRREETSVYFVKRIYIQGSGAETGPEAREPENR